MTKSPLPPAIRALLACPQCHGPLGDELGDDGTEAHLTCNRCRLAYPVRDGIPVMLLDQASAIVPQ